MTDHAPAFADAVERIEPCPGGIADDGAPGSDSVQALARWWQRVGSGPRRIPAWIQVSGDGAVAGVAAAERAVDAGANLLIPRPDRATSDLEARAVIAVLTHRDAAAVVDQVPGMTDAEWMRDATVVRDRIAALIPLRGEPRDLVHACQDPAIADLVGVLIGAASRRTPCLVDGLRVMAAAVVADRLSPAACGWWRAASTSADPAWLAAVDRIELDPGLPLSISADDGSAARATLVLLDLESAPDVD